MPCNFVWISKTWNCLETVLSIDIKFHSCNTYYDIVGEVCQTQSFWNKVAVCNRGLSRANILKLGWFHRYCDKDVFGLLDVLLSTNFLFHLCGPRKKIFQNWKGLYCTSEPWASFIWNFFNGFILVEKRLFLASLK